MIKQLENLPENMVGFSAEGDVTEEDYENSVLPACKRVVEKTGTLNFMLVLNTDVKNFTYGAWMQDAYLGIKNLFKWNHVAIVTDKDGIRKLTDIMSVFVPGEFKGFEHSELQDAIDWVSGKPS